MMLDTIVEILKEQKNIGWVVREEDNSTAELFFVRDRLDMNRRTAVHEYVVHIYLDFAETGEEYTGDATTVIGISDTRAEVEAKIQDAVFSAGLIKNKRYPLPPKGEGEPAARQIFHTLAELEAGYDELGEIFFGNHPYDAEVNSVELFAIEGRRRVRASSGVDVSYPYSEFMFELVTDNNSGEEAVEIFRDYSLGRLDLALVRRITEQQLLETEGRSKAVPGQKQENCRVVLTGDAVEEFLFFYVDQATDSAVYHKISRAKLGESYLPQDAAQKLNIRMNPALANSVASAPVDSEGTLLSAYPLYEDGVVKTFRTHARFSHYLGMPHIGFVRTFEVDGGDLSLEEVRKEDHIELQVFSAFLMDGLTGDFGGEYRLAKQVKDGKITYLTGGALSENIFKVQGKMRFSKELLDRQFSRAPEAIILEDVTLAGR